MKKIFCFGEILLRMSPALEGKWLKDAMMPVYIGGAELNVASALSGWKQPVRYCTAMPANYLSEEILDELQLKQIDISFIQLLGNRIGSYYLPQGADLKNTGVIYDRQYSSFSELKTGMIDWDEALNNCDWFHFSAISPALNEDIASVCQEALKAASTKGLRISVDLNYRSRLWQYGKQPTSVMPALVQHCDVIMGNLWAVEQLLGIPSPIKNSDGLTKEELADASRQSFQALQKAYPKAKSIGFTFRLESSYWGILHHHHMVAVSRNFEIQKVIDKVGTGDCFMAGLIYGIKNDHPVQVIVDFAAAAAVGKLYEKGDATHQTIEQVLQRL